MAQAELDSIDAAIEALGVATDPKAIVERLAALAETPCLRMLGGLELEPTSGLALKTYWREGGERYVRGYSKLGLPGDRLLWVPPSMRQALTWETNPQSPFRELLCRFDDEACGAETRGWALRAAHELEILGAHEPDATDCRKRASEAEPNERFRMFRDCQLAEQREHASLPIGAIRAPKRGWLVVQGRRGHHSYCDERRAYDLATGSAYRVASCGGLALRADGSVDERKTNAGPQTVIELGHLPVQALREAAWMLLLLDSVDRKVVESFGSDIPSDVPLTVDTGYSSAGMGMSMHWTSGDTTLSWQIEHNDGSVIKADDDLTWSTRVLDDAPSEHAVTLLRVAEAGMFLDCPNSPPPASLVRKGGTEWQAARQRQRACAARRP